MTKHLLIIKQKIEYLKTVGETNPLHLEMNGSLQQSFAQ